MDMPFGTEQFGPELTVEGLKAEELLTDSQNIPGREIVWILSPSGCFARISATRSAGACAACWDAFDIWNFNALMEMRYAKQRSGLHHF
jgi:hypothetical protein